jgi:formylglycine-generating enzyme
MLFAMMLVFVSACGERNADSAQSANKRICAEKPVGKIVSIKGGKFQMGANPAYPEEGPAREVFVGDFKIDASEVTNGQFKEFIAATGYVTDAEKKPPDAEKLPAQFRQAGSAVFFPPDQENPNWWRWTKGASWKHPLGSASSIEGKNKHPVVHVSYADASSYAAWKGGRLPTEKEWEYAARAGTQTSAPPKNSQGAIEANHYQGVFPQRDLGTDGFTGTAPAGCFKPNNFGLYDMIGNVWEWTRGEPDETSTTAVIKGGSFLCAQNYCARYRPSARQFQERDLGTNHVGFRVVYD